MKKSQVTRSHFLKPDQKLPKPVEPRVSHFDNPSPGFVSRDFFSTPRGTTWGRYPRDRIADRAECPVYPLSAQRFCSQVPSLGGDTTLLSSTTSIWVTSCRLAPVTTSESGTPRASTRRWRLLPFFSPIRRILSDGLLSQRCFGHRSIDGLPFPGNPFHLVVLSQTVLPEFQEHSGLIPFPKIPVNGAGTPEPLLRQSLPLNPCPKHIDDSFKDLARINGLPASPGLPLVGSVQ